MATETQAIQGRDDKQVYELALQGPITDLAALQKRMEQLAQIANVVMPTVLGPIPAKQAVQPAVVQIDTTTDDEGMGREVYFSAGFGMKRGKTTDDDEIGLGKIALLKLLGAAGWSPDIPGGHGRLDDSGDTRYCEFRAVIKGRDITGQWQTSTATMELDLRDGSSEAKTMTPRQLEATRRKLVRLAEAKAINAAIRGNPQMPLPQKIKRRLAARLWIIPRLVPHYDPSDPTDMEFARRQAAGESSLLFGEKAPERPVIQGEVISATTVVPGGGDGQDAAGGPQTVRARPAGSTPAPSTTNGDPFELGDLAEPEQDSPALIVCLCPCSCQKEITAEVAEKTQAQLGTPRCAECFPGRRFSASKHKDVADFKIPNFPKLTLEQILKSIKK